MIKGGIVTYDQGSSYDTSSNTYVYQEKLNSVEVLLSHPLTPKINIIVEEEKLNQTQAVMRNPVELCLYYANQNKELLGHTHRADLQAMCYYFVVERNFTMKQRSDLASICGKIASVQLHNNMEAASKLIIDNRPLLDDFHVTLYNNFESVIRDSNTLKKKSERFAVFNLAGFVLAQLPVGA